MHDETSPEPSEESQAAPSPSNTREADAVTPGGESEPRSDDEPSDAFYDDVGLLGIGSRVFPPDGDYAVFEDSGAVEYEPPTYADDPSVEARIREIEARLDGLRASVPESDLDAAPRATERGGSRPAPADEAVHAARELLESDYFRRQWGRGSLRERSAEVDGFGFDADVEQRLRPLVEFLYKRYFRVTAVGAEHLPREGRGIVVANHSGALPFDGVMLREAARLAAPHPRDLRWLAEDWSFYLPFLGVTLNRIGAVRACPENGERLLLAGHLLGVFPEGSGGPRKLYRDRYTLRRFGRGGFVRLALRTRSPIVPAAVIGAEESYPVLYRLDNLTKLFGIDYLPITPTFPALGLLGLIPAPTKWQIVFGEPISVAEYGPEAAADHVLVGRIAERVRTAIGSLLDAGLRRRKSVWL
jgi:1-acyl-sn-glycerol-3-phosphate acyltransferase